VSPIRRLRSGRQLRGREPPESEALPGKRPITPELKDNLAVIRDELGVGVSFDIVVREFAMAGRDGALLFVDGFVNEIAGQRVLDRLLAIRREDLAIDPVDRIMKEHLNFIEVKVVKTLDEVIETVLMGPMILLVDGCDQAIVIDIREYPIRNPEEPDLERVLRGSRDSFVETIIFNTALIRRRVRDPGLRVELLRVGRRSKTDVALCYIQDIADPDLVDEVRRRLREIRVDGIPMAEKPLQEFLVGPEKRWNPFPTVRFTERPDVAAVHLYEGHVALVIDSTPSAILLPATFWHHLQHAQEFREEALPGAVTRWVRMIAMALSWLAMPLYLALSLSRDILGPAFEFIGPKDPTRLSLFAQFIIIDIFGDIIRIALIHTPGALSTGLGFFGAILVSDLAVRAGILTNEVIIYFALAILGQFATPNMEMAQALRLSRFVLLLLAGFWKLPGLAIGVLATFLFLASLRSFGVPYLWPLLPFNGRALWRILVRGPTPERGRRPEILRPIDPDRA